MNLASTIIPKSDQLNADDLISGPRTIRVDAVEAGSAEQPVSIYYDGDKKRPYKPSKSMRRVLVALWGSEAENYVGRKLTLYRDPNIKFGGEPVGGICISHASHISEPTNVLLTVTRGKRKPFCVMPLCVSGEQAAKLEELIAACRGVNGFDEAAFWKWANASNTSEIEAVKYEKAVASLQKKLGGA